MRRERYSARGGRAGRAGQVVVLIVAVLEGQKASGSSGVVGPSQRVHLRGLLHLGAFKQPRSTSSRITPTVIAWSAIRTLAKVGKLHVDVVHDVLEADAVDGVTQRPRDERDAHGRARHGQAGAGR